jgi:hypothetical protein
MMQTVLDPHLTATDKADPRLQQLLDLIGRLPPDKATKLRELLAAEGGLSSGGKGLDVVFKALERRHGDEGADAPEPLMRRICHILEPFLVDEAPRDSAGNVQRRSLTGWWTAALAQSKKLRGFETQYLQAAKAGKKAELERIVAETVDDLAECSRKLTLKTTAQGTIEDVRRIAVILSGGMPLVEMLQQLGVDRPPSQPGLQLDDRLVRRFGQAYEKLGESKAFDPVWLGHAVMNHLAQPCDVVSLIHRITGCTDIQVLEHTELAPLVARTIDHLVVTSNQAVAALKMAARSAKAEDLEKAATLAATYFDAAEAVAREIKIDRLSAWGQAYMNSRKDLSDLIPDKVEDYEDVLVGYVEEFDPVQHGSEENPAFRNAVAAARLLGTLKARSSRHGFGMAFANLERRTRDLLGRPMKRPPAGTTDGWPGQKRRLLQELKFA